VIQVDPRLVILATLTLLTLPQQYSGGAAVAHPHAIFQFWIVGGHLTAANHHGQPSDDDDPYVPSKMSAPHSTRLVDDPVVPTISDATPSAERADAIGGVLSAWTFPLLSLSLLILWLGRVLTGIASSPEPPPPRYRAGFAFAFGSVS
jgi:hypothetical protein